MPKKKPILVEYNGEELPLAQVAASLGVPYNTALGRYKRGVSIDHIHIRVLKLQHCKDCHTEDPEDFYRDNRSRCRQCTYDRRVGLRDLGAIELPWRIEHEMHLDTALELTKLEREYWRPISELSSNRLGDNSKKHKYAI